MPAERSKVLKRSDSVNQFVWASQPQEPSSSTDGPFMTTLSVCDDMPPLVNAPTTEFIMVPPTGEVTSTRKQPHSKKRPENHIPRPPNAFILFRSSFIKSQQVSNKIETSHSTLSKIIGLTWQSLSKEDRKVWHVKAKEALDEHKRKFPEYSFRPTQNKGPEKRRVKEIEPKDMKRCTKIAQLIVEGKTGDELNAAIQEFDKHHVPEIITRFEAPITERAFRRSSSAPIPDTESAKSGQSFLQHVSSMPRKPRSSSTQPSRCSSPIEAFSSFNNSLVSPMPVPFKEEVPAFTFDGFSFNNIASPASDFDLDPLGTQDTDAYSEPYGTPLSINTTFTMDDWSSSPLTLSPSTPDFMRSPTPMSGSPTPSFDDCFDNYTHGHQKSCLDDFSAQFSLFGQACIPAHQPNICDNGIDLSFGNGSESLFAAAAFGTDAHAHAQHQDASALSHLGHLDFSAFMAAIPQYAM